MIQMASSTEEYWSCRGQQEEDVSMLLTWRSRFYKKFHFTLIMTVQAVPTIRIGSIVLQCEAVPIYP